MFKLKKDLKAGELMEVDLGNDLCEEVKGRNSGRRGNTKRVMRLSTILLRDFRDLVLLKQLVRHK